MGVLREGKGWDWKASAHWGDGRVESRICLLGSQPRRLESWRMIGVAWKEFSENGERERERAWVSDRAIVWYNVKEEYQKVYGKGVDKEKK